MRERAKALGFTTESAYIQSLVREDVLRDGDRTISAQAPPDSLGAAMPRPAVTRTQERPIGEPMEPVMSKLLKRKAGEKAAASAARK